MAAVCGVVLHHEGPAGGVDGMLAAMSHYGAGSAAWTDAGVGLGLRSATDVLRDVPALAPDVLGSVIVAAARLDDRDALCDALGLPPTARADHGDPALILKAYRRWGVDCPHHLLGDYAFAIWDGRRRSLFCARDHIGVQPFYYAETPRGFVFGSTIEAVLAGPDVDHAFDDVMVAMFLRVFSIPFGTRTFFRSVRRLLPGHVLFVGDGVVQTRRYWRPEDVPPAPPASDEDHAGAFMDIYSRAVKDRLRGSGRVGVHLSGGLDSSSVAVLAARELRRQGRPPPLAFSWLPPPRGEGPPAPEYAAMAAVAGQEGLQVYHGSFDAADFLTLMRLDSVFPQAQIGFHEVDVQHEAAAQGVRVLLSGLGGDEGISYSGNGYYAHLLLSGRWAALFAEARARRMNPLRLMARTVVRTLPYGRDLFRQWKRLRKRLRKEFVPRHMSFINPEFARNTPLPPATVFRPTSVRCGQLMRLGFGALWRRTERDNAAGAFHGLEYRYPLLDRRVLEFALSLPPEMFRRGPTTRWLMRHALDLWAVLPPEVCWKESKTEQVRLDAELEIFLEAIPMIRQRIISPAAPLRRARYVDMPRLIEYLDPTLPPPVLLRAHWSVLHFLDF